MKPRILSYFIPFALMTLIMTSMILIGIGSIYLFAIIVLWELIPIQLELFLLTLRTSFGLGTFIGMCFTFFDIVNDFRKSFLKTYRGER